MTMQEQFIREVERTYADLLPRHGAMGLKGRFEDWDPVVQLLVKALAAQVESVMPEAAVGEVLEEHPFALALTEMLRRHFGGAGLPSPAHVVVGCVVERKGTEAVLLDSTTRFEMQDVGLPGNAPVVFSPRGDVLVLNVANPEVRVRAQGEDLVLGVEFQDKVVDLRFLEREPWNAIPSIPIFYRGPAEEHEPEPRLARLWLYLLKHAPWYPAQDGPGGGSSPARHRWEPDLAAAWTEEVPPRLIHGALTEPGPFDYRFIRLPRDFWTRLRPGTYSPDEGACLGIRIPWGDGAAEVAAALDCRLLVNAVPCWNLIRRHVEPHENHWQGDVLTLRVSPEEARDGLLVERVVDPDTGRCFYDARELLAPTQDDRYTVVVPQDATDRRLGVRFVFDRRPASDDGRPGNLRVEFYTYSQRDGAAGHRRGRKFVPQAGSMQVGGLTVTTLVSTRRNYGPDSEQDIARQFLGMLGGRDRCVTRADLLAAIARFPHLDLGTLVDWPGVTLEPRLRRVAGLLREVTQVTLPLAIGAPVSHQRLDPLAQHLETYLNARAPLGANVRVVFAEPRG